MSLRIRIRNFLLDLTEQELAGRAHHDQSIESALPYFLVDDQESPHYGKILRDRRNGDTQKRKIR